MGRNGHPERSPAGGGNERGSRYGRSRFLAGERRSAAAARALRAQPKGAVPRASGDQEQRVLFILGTRPEAIKLAPVVHACAARGAIRPVIACVRQHEAILDQALDAFELEADLTVELERSGSHLGELTSQILSKVGELVVAVEADLVVVQGDTTTALAGALAAFYERIPVGHVEAGLRTRHLSNPYPEELNRQLIARIADLHFAPTEQAKANLLQEGIPASRISVTGNTVIDALRIVKGTSETEPNQGPARLLVTAHRRESWGHGLEQICMAIADINRCGLDLDIHFVVHPNPAVSSRVRAALEGRPRITISGPLAYRDFVKEMVRADVILTDSGGIQEEAPALGTSVLVMREHTERTEGIESGSSKLVGLDRREIRRETIAALAQASLPSRSVDLEEYGDGFAADRIVNRFSEYIRQVQQDEIVLKGADVDVTDARQGVAGGLLLRPATSSGIAGSNG